MILASSTRFAIEEVVHFFRYYLFFSKQTAVFLPPKQSECQSCFEKMTFLYSGFMSIFVGIQFDFGWSQFSGEVGSSSSEGPQKMYGEPLLLS